MLYIRYQIKLRIFSQQFQRICKRYLKFSKGQIFQTWKGQLKDDENRMRQSFGTQTPRDWVTCGESGGPEGTRVVKTLSSNSGHLNRVLDG